MRIIKPIIVRIALVTIISSSINLQVFAQENNFLDQYITDADASLEVLSNLEINDSLVEESSTISSDEIQIQSEEIIEFKDDNLKKAINIELGKLEDSPITKLDLEGLSVLKADNLEISNLEGLEYATNLTELYLQHNKISDSSLLSKVNFINLKILDLSFNQITDISFLGGDQFLNLEKLYLNDQLILLDENEIEEKATLKIENLLRGKVNDYLYNIQVVNGYSEGEFFVWDNINENANLSVIFNEVMQFGLTETIFSGSIIIPVKVNPNDVIEDDSSTDKNLNVEDFQVMDEEVIQNSKIHFLPVEGDAILIESNGRFALIDGGEDSDNPRGFPNLNYKGYEDFVVDYIKKVAADENGEVVLDFIVGTHAHSDHIGGLDTVVNDPQIHVSTAYLKRYDENKISEWEVQNWDNQQVYDQLLEALFNEGATIIQDISSDPFELGELTIKILNVEYDSDNVKRGENENSLGVLVSKDNQSIFLSGDINNIDGDEDRLAPQIGEVTLLKLGHHGLDKSSTTNFLRQLKLSYAIATNYEKNISKLIRRDLSDLGTNIYATMNNNGIVVTFGEENLGLDVYDRVFSGWRYINNNWYYVGVDGDYLTGWNQLVWGDDLDCYYFDEEGRMLTGWLNQDNDRYYLKSDGKMATGWLSEKDDWYYLKSSGEMATGWEKVGNKWYYMNSNGKMKTGWLNENEKWYYLKSSGEMATNTTVEGWKIDNYGVATRL